MKKLKLSIWLGNDVSHTFFSPEESRETFQRNTRRICTAYTVPPSVLIITEESFSLPKLIFVITQSRKFENMRIPCMPCIRLNGYLRVCNVPYRNNN